jgi:glutamate 5-kinase
MKTSATRLKRLVVKIGTNLLSGKRASEGHVMETVVRELCDIKTAHGIDVLVVSSGAVGFGMNALGLERRPTLLPEKQAVAAVGQSRLMHYYETLVGAHSPGLTTAQVLLTQADLDERRNYLNVRNTLVTLFGMKNVIPVINENDSTATEELRFGDNDTLAAKIAAKINADLLIILTDVDGLYDRNPDRDKSARLIAEVAEISHDLDAVAGGAGSIASTGGMRTKLSAARIATAAGVRCVIANGFREGIIHGVLEGDAPCTQFLPAHAALSHRKRWIAFGRSVRGMVRIDDGARAALLERGKSLLPAGVTAVEGQFESGAAVRIVDSAGELIARGLVNYGSDDIRSIMRHKSAEIAALLGHKDFDEIVHRDNLVVL